MIAYLAFRFGVSLRGGRSAAERPLETEIERLGNARRKAMEKIYEAIEAPR